MGFVFEIEFLIALATTCWKITTPQLNSLLLLYISLTVSDLCNRLYFYLVLVKAFYVIIMEFLLSLA